MERNCVEWTGESEHTGTSVRVRMWGKCAQADDEHIGDGVCLEFVYKSAIVISVLGPTNIRLLNLVHLLRLMS